MNRKKIEVGMRVFVKENGEDSWADPRQQGQFATIIACEGAGYEGNLTIRVKTAAGDRGWMSHVDVRKLREWEV